MKLDLRCPTDVFAGFKSGLYKAIIVTGTRKPGESGSNVNLGDLVVVKNCNSPSQVTFEVYQISKYMGASTLETALRDLSSNVFPGANDYDRHPFYLAQNDATGLLPRLYEGIYAILIRQYKKKGRTG